MHFPVKESFYEKAKGNQSSSEVLWKFHQLALKDSVLFVPEPSIQGPGTATRYLFAKGEIDSETAMLRLILNFRQDFGGPQDQNREEALIDLDNYLGKLAKLSEHFVSTGTAAYNEYYKDLSDNLQEAGVWNDIAGEIDAERAGATSDEEEEIQERCTVQRWQQIIK